jgi:hypothetical protein
MGLVQGPRVVWRVSKLLARGHGPKLGPYNGSDIGGLPGTNEWRVMGWPYGVPSVGAVVGRTLRWWRETTGEPVIIGWSRPS